MELPPDLFEPFSERDRDNLRALLRMSLSDLFGRLTRLHHSTCLRRDEAQKALDQFAAEYQPNPVAAEYGYNPVADEAVFTSEVERMMFATVAVAIDSEKERFVISICEDWGLAHQSKSGQPNFSAACISLSGAIGVDPRDLPGGDVHEQARVLANCFKHHGGRKNAEAVEFLQGQPGDEIEYESLDWKAMIDATVQVLDEVVQRLK